MIRHISVFTFRDGPDKQENIRAVREFLEELPSACDIVKNQTVAAPAAPAPELPEDAPVMFGDLVQVCDFESAADAAAYPATDAHSRLAEFSTPMLKKITVIDYEL